MHENSSVLEPTGSRSHLAGAGSSADGTRVVQRPQIPDEVLAMCAFDHPDYGDLFTAATPAAEHFSPEQWARAGVSDAAGAAGQFVWRVILGLRLAPVSSPDHIGGWQIADGDATWTSLVASSWCLTANIVIAVAPEEVSAATFIRYDKPPAAFLWPVVAAGHRSAMPRLLHAAVRRLARDQ
ncbi:MAG TPA: hypothetical protein VHJ82_04430 [Actinomycetota bacterium]|nr:hypothetical protein [Actinomycetota bacterium]